MDKLERRVYKAFRYADIEGKQFLTKHQYKIAMTVVFGYCPDRFDVKQVFSRTLKPKDLITFEQFKNSIIRKIHSTKDFLDLEYLFTFLDKKFKGYLELEDFLTAANDVNFKISPTILKSAFKELNRSRNGFIGIDEFAIIMGEDCNK